MNADEECHSTQQRVADEEGRTADVCQPGDEKYRLLVEHAREAIYVVQQGVVVFANQAFAEMADLGDVSAVGMSIEEFVPPEDRAGAREHHRRMIAGEAAENPYETRALSRKGVERWVSINVVLIVWDGRPATLNLATDITRHRRTDESLRQVHERLVLSQRSARAGTWDWDMTTNALACSPELNRLFGLDAARAKASFEAWAQVLHPEDAATAEQQLREAIREHVPLEQEYRIRLPSGEVRWISALGDTTYDAGGHPVRMTGICLDVTARKRAELSLRESEQKFRTIIDLLPIGVSVMDRQGRILEFNTALRDILRISQEGLLRGDHQARRYFRADGTSLPMQELPSARALAEGKPVRETEIGVAVETGEVVWTLVSAAPLSVIDPMVVVATCDITDRKYAEHEREITVEFLRLVNESSGTADLIHKAVLFFQARSGCDAVGIRLREGDDYPYFEARGFPPEFVAAENQLCARDPAGQVVRDGAGNPLIECMCGNVICGRFDPSKPFFTKKGSFWTNGTTALLASTTDADRQARTRNRCNGEGYESVALLPLRFGEERLGLLQLNRRTKGAFTPQSIALWERLADHLSLALSQSRAYEAMRISEETYRSLFENLLNGFAYCRMICDDHDQPLDFIYLRVNRAFTTHTGLKDVEGKRASEVIPGIREADPELMETYQRVAMTGQPETFERYVNSLQMWFHIAVYSPQRGYFVAVFDVITERKQTEIRMQEQLDELTRWHTAMFGRESRILELKYEVNELLAKQGQAPRYESATEPAT